jgi:AraC-like DNA-binding protein
MQVLSTDVVPAHEAFAYWREVLAQHFIHLRPERIGLDPFFSAIDVQRLQGHSFSRVRAAPQRVHRALGEIARSPYDLVFLNVHLHGKGSYRQNGDELVLCPGDLFIIDAVRPFELGCEGGVTHISLKVPRRMLRERMRDADHAVGAHIPGTSHIGKLLNGYIKTLWRAGEADQLTDYPQAIDRLFSLVAYEVDRRFGHAPLPRRAVRTGIYARAVSYIEEAHRTPELAPCTVADAVGTSLRTLQGIFTERGDAIGRRIRNARIAAAARWLADPAMRDRKIGEVAFMTGFCELSHFTHAFVRAYKETPGVWRRRRLGG